jgi:rare lipoprotein A
MIGRTIATYAASIFLGASALLVAAEASAGSGAQRGVASWYKHGRKTANGEAFNPHGLTAAHRSLPFGSRVKVVSERTGREVVVRINDRGPFARGRIIDLSLGSARALGMASLDRVALYPL